MNTGRTTGRIVSHDLRTSGKGTSFVALGIEIDGEGIQCPIWLTDKSFNMARAQLQICGFDVDKRDLEELDGTQLLVGVQVPVEITDEAGRLRCQIVLQQKPSKAEIGKLNKGLRAAKKATQLPLSTDPIGDSDIPF